MSAGNIYPFTHAVISRPVNRGIDAAKDWSLDALCRSKTEADRFAERSIAAYRFEQEDCETMIINWPERSSPHHRIENIDPPEA